MQNENAERNAELKRRMAGWATFTIRRRPCIVQSPRGARKIGARGGRQIDDCRTPSSLSILEICILNSAF
jgi:hypothetical protein